jgi:hypothetical protein
MALRQSGDLIDDALPPRVAPVHWNHINLTGDYGALQPVPIEPPCTKHPGKGTFARPGPLAVDHPMSERPYRQPRMDWT